jgi:GAF domain-containing protein
VKAMNKNLFIKEYQALIKDETDTIALLSNTSAFLNNILNNINWVGFYLYKNKELVLGPFQGKVACTHIPLDKGVCGKAAKTLETQRISNVHQFEGHIACDSVSESEIVLPIVKNNQLFGVLDIDAPIQDRFSLNDQNFLEEIINILKQSL